VSALLEIRDVSKAFGGVQAVSKVSLDVAKGALAGSRRAGSAPFALALIDGSVGVVVAPRGRLQMAVAFEIRGGKVATLDIIADRERLARLHLALLEP